MEDKYILAIESSCDETSAAVVLNGREILSNVIASQISTHEQYGGVVPEVASRMHIEAISGVVEEALLKANKPSIFFKSLKDMNQLSYWFKEVEDLIGINQSEIHHPEGDVFTHTMMVLDEAAKLRDQAKNKLAFMLAALCHDFGKTVTTEIKKGKLTAYGHEVESVTLAKGLLDRLTNKISLKKETLNLIKLHLIWFHM